MPAQQNVLATCKSGQSTGPTVFLGMALYHCCLPTIVWTRLSLAGVKRNEMALDGFSLTFSDWWWFVRVWCVMSSRQFPVRSMHICALILGDCLGWWYLVILVVHPSKDSHKPSYNATIWPYYTLLTLLITSYQSLGLHSLSRHSSRLEHDQRRTGTYVDPQAELPNGNKERGYIYDFKRYPRLTIFIYPSLYFHVTYPCSMFIHMRMVKTWCVCKDLHRVWSSQYQ